jgi:hypothetical protein
LQDYLGLLCKNIRNGAYSSEAEVRSEFMRNVRNFLDHDDFKGVAIREEEWVIESRPDARIGRLSIEFESPVLSGGRLRERVTEEKIAKVQQKYVKEFKQIGRPVRSIITNGLEMIFLDEDGNLVERGPIC